MFLYQVYGLGISCTHALRYLTSTSTTDNQRITIDLSNQIPVELTVSEGWLRIYPEQGSEHIGVSVDQRAQWFRIHFPRDQETSLVFYLSACGQLIHSDKSASIPQSDIESFLIGPVLGFALRLLRKTCLHASVLSYQEHALALLGPKGAGKSTMASALLEQGAKLVADDLAVLDFDGEQIMVNAGYPALRLLPATLKIHSLDVDDWKPVLSVGEKRVVPLPNEQLTWQFDQQKRPLSCLYVLNQREAQLASIRIDELSSRESVLALAPHRYPGYALDQQHKTLAFSRIAQLAKAVSVKKLTCTDNLHKLSYVASSILEDFSTTIEDSFS
jgi:hypothetical protein